MFKAIHINRNQGVRNQGVSQLDLCAKGADLAIKRRGKLSCNRHFIGTGKNNPPQGEVYGSSEIHAKVGKLVSRATKLTAHEGDRKSPSYSVTKNQAG